MKVVTALLVCLVACTPLHPRVTLERGASLKGYRVFVVGPVTDATGYSFGFPVTDSLRQRIAARLKAHGLTIAETSADTSGPVLVITSTLDAFRSGLPARALLLPDASGISRCRLSGELTDRRATGRRIGQIVASEMTDQDTPTSPFALLMRCARVLADEIDRQVKKR